ncbi:MAG: hypothetical protein KIT72_00390 [Polyangiaceae bacterium]|nr:hypothetical protein [Polyangiaceae bacterium]MCW5788854.1 hypothetical protein [Polyangiaceae bacterium]
MTVQNLDAACAKLGAKLAASGNKDTENSITKALGVLEEQGVYALLLYLVARESGKFVPDLLEFMEQWCGLQNGRQLWNSWADKRKKLDEFEKKLKSAKAQGERDKAKKDLDAAKKTANDARDAIFNALSGHSSDLDKLLFARDLLHRALVYARYHAKAAQTGGAKA